MNLIQRLSNTIPIVHKRAYKITYVDRVKGNTILFFNLEHKDEKTVMAKNARDAIAEFSKLWTWSCPVCIYSVTEVK